MDVFLDFYRIFFDVLILIGLIVILFLAIIYFYFRVAIWA